MPTPRLLFSTGSLYTHDPDISFELAADLGFDGVELMTDARPATRDPDTIKRLMDQYTIPVPVIHSPFRTDIPGWEGNSIIDMVRNSVTLAEKIGAEIVVMHLPSRIGFKSVKIGGKQRIFPSPFNPQVDVKRWLESGELAAYQETTSIKIAVENLPLHRDKFLPGVAINAFHWNTVQKWAAIHPYLTLDTTHWGTHNIDPVKAYQVAGKRVTHIHLSNLHKKGYVEHRLPHHGDLDLATFLRTLTINGYTGTISLELHPDALESTDEHAIRRNLTVSHRFCRENLTHV